MTDQPNPYAAAPVAPRTGQARVALVLAGIIVLLSIVSGIVGQLLPLIVNSMDLPISSAGFIFVPFQIVQLVLAIVSIVLAIGPLSSGPRVIAGIAVGVSASWIITAFFTLVSSLLLSAVY
jgi:hypothetical protein